MRKTLTTLPEPRLPRCDLRQVPELPAPPACAPDGACTPHRSCLRWVVTSGAGTWGALSTVTSEENARRSYFHSTLVFRHNRASRTSQ